MGKKKDALDELYLATAITERLANPALHVTVAAALLEVEPDETIAAGTRHAVGRVLCALSDPTMRDRFLAADAVRRINSAGR